MLCLIKRLHRTACVLCCGAGISLISSIGNAYAQSLLSIEPLSETVFRVIYHGAKEGNFDNNLVVSVGDDGVFMVDHRNTTDNLILPFIEKELGKSIELAVNTHWHPDHTNGNQWYDHNVVIFAHESTRARRAAVQFPSWAPNGLPALPSNALPDITFDRNITVYFNSEMITLHALPVGHTDSDIVIMFTESKVAALGDVFNGRGQLSGYDYFSGDPRNYVVELDRLLALLPDGYALVTGHGGMATKNDIAEYRTLYAALLEELDRRRNSGATVREAVELGLPADWLNWLSQPEYEESGDWLLETASRLWADAAAETSKELN